MNVKDFLKFVQIIATYGIVFFYNMVAIRTNTKSLAKEFSEILIFEYFGYFKIGFDVFLTLIPNHPRMTSGKNANLRSNGRKTHFYVAMGQSSAKREKRLHFSFGLGFGIGLGYGLG